MSKLSLLVSMTLLPGGLQVTSVLKERDAGHAHSPRAERDFPRPPLSSGYTLPPVKQGITLIKRMKTPQQASPIQEHKTVEIRHTL